MNNILTISKQELVRLRMRFRGRSRYAVLAILSLALISAYLIYHQGFVICKGLYIAGISFDAPPPEKGCFSWVRMEPATGQARLREGSIDLYVEANRVLFRGDLRSQYAAGALQKHLEEQELLRIARQYQISQAFPLRVEIRHLESKETTLYPVTAKPSPVLRLEEEPAPPRFLEIPRKAELTGPGKLGVGTIGEPVTPGLLEPGTVSGEPIPGQQPLPQGSFTDSAVREHLEKLVSGSRLPEFRASFVSEKDIVIPSLMSPPIPLSLVILAYLYIVPIFFVSIFFTSSFTEEKVNRKLIVLLSAPVSPFQIILGKMLPYLVYSVAIILGVTLILQGSILLGLAIFVPVMLFIFSIYLIVALTYRTFKDQTFLSVLALSGIILYLLLPAMFTGVSDLSYISPLTLAVQMFRGESFGVSQYFLATAPLYLIFLQTLFIGTRVFNEQYLMGFRPLHTKMAEALYLAMDKRHPSISVFLLSLFLVPAVFMVQLVSIVFVSNLPLSLWILVAVSVIVEETAKSAGIVVLLHNKAIEAQWDVVRLAFLSALGFLFGEKLLLFFALKVLSESVFTSAVFGAGLLIIPLALHVISTGAVCMIVARQGTKYYPLAILAGSLIHSIYNLSVIRAFL